MKQKNRKTLTATIMILLLALTVAACSSGGKQGGGDPTAAPKPTSNNASTDPTAEPQAELEEVTLTIYFPGDSQKDEQLVEAAMNDYLKDKINAKIDLNPVEWGSWDNRINLMFASGEPADIVFTAAWNGFTVNVGKGAFLDITDLIEQYGTEMKEVINPAYLEGSKIEGRNYAVPTNKELAATRGVFVRQDLAEKYNMDLGTIKTHADLEPFLQIIRDSEPGITPFYVSNETGLLTNLNWDSLGDNTIPGVLHKIGTATTILNQPETPEFMEAAKLARQWYQAGYINSDAGTTTVKADEMMKAGTVFAYTAALKPGAADEVGRNTGYSLVQIDLTEPTITTGDTTGSMLAITRASKNPERALMFINLLHTDKTLNNLFNYGVEGTHYVKVSDNVIKHPDGVEASSSGYNPGTNWMIGNQFLNFLFENENPDKWKLFEEFNDKGIPSIALGFSFDSESVKSEIAASVNVTNEFYGALNAGTVDPEQYIPRYIDRLKQAGVDRIIEEKQRQFDEWLASK